MINQWPRIKDLPIEQQKPFDLWLNHQTRPLIEGLPREEQDGYFSWDYDRWIAGKPIID